MVSRGFPSVLGPSAGVPLSPLKWMKWSAAQRTIPLSVASHSVSAPGRLKYQTGPMASAAGLSAVQLVREEKQIHLCLVACSDVTRCVMMMSSGGGGVATV